MGIDCSGAGGSFLSDPGCTTVCLLKPLKGTLKMCSIL